MDLISKSQNKFPQRGSKTLLHKLNDVCSKYYPLSSLFALKHVINHCNNTHRELPAMSSFSHSAAKSHLQTAFVCSHCLHHHFHQNHSTLRSVCLRAEVYFENLFCRMSDQWWWSFLFRSGFMIKPFNNTSCCTGQLLYRRFDSFWKDGWKHNISFLIPFKSFSVCVHTDEWMFGWL